MPTPRDILIKRVHDLVDNYESTVLGLQGFRFAITWRDKLVAGHRFSLGRKMTPTATHETDNRESVTPDGVLQIGDAIGYVVEAKRSMPADQQYWHKDLDQVQKYDQDLVGWWTASETIPRHNVVLLVWTTLTKEFETLIEVAVNNRSARLTDRVSLVEFSQIKESQEVMRYRHEWGTLSDEGIASRLRSGISVPLAVLIAPADKQVKFYDAQPPTEYLMAILWQNVFNGHMPELEFDTKRDAWPIEVSVGDLAEELRRLHGSEGEGPRERRFPREAWVQDALEAFSKIGFAEHIEDDRYLVLFKPNLRTTKQRDLISRFAAHRTVQPLEDPESGQQLSLFGDGKSG